MQSNEIDPGLVSKISEKNIIDELIVIYKNHFNKAPHDKMKIPLKQAYIHLQFNDYLFKAMLMHDNYHKFENEILREYIINDEKLLEIFDNNFILYELRLIANELKRRDILKRKALATPIGLSTDAEKNNAESANSPDTDCSKCSAHSAVAVYQTDSACPDCPCSGYTGSALESQGFGSPSYQLAYLANPNLRQTVPAVRLTG